MYSSHVVLYRFGVIVLITITAKMLFITSKNIHMYVHVKNKKVHFPIGKYRTLNDKIVTLTFFTVAHLNLLLHEVS